MIKLLCKTYLKELFTEQVLAYVFAIFFTNFLAILLVPTVADNRTKVHTYYLQNVPLPAKNGLAPVSRLMPATGLFIGSVDHVRILQASRIHLEDLNTLSTYLCDGCYTQSISQGLKSATLWRCNDCKQSLKTPRDGFTRMEYTRESIVGINQSDMDYTTIEVGFWRYLFTFFFPVVLLVNHLATLHLNALMRYDALKYAINSDQATDLMLKLILVAAIPTVIGSTAYLLLATRLFERTILRRYYRDAVKMPPLVRGHNYTPLFCSLLCCLLYLLRWHAVTRKGDVEYGVHTGRVILGMLSYAYVKTSIKYLAVAPTQNAPVKIIPSVANYCRQILRLESQARKIRYELHVFRYRPLPYLWGLWFAAVLVLWIMLTKACQKNLDTEQFIAIYRKDHEDITDHASRD